jgi:hypothetical protein
VDRKRSSGRRVASTSLGRGERADRDGVSVRIAEGELPTFECSGSRGLLLEADDKSACPVQGLVVVDDAGEQEEPIAR